MQSNPRHHDRLLDSEDSQHYFLIDQQDLNITQDVKISKLAIPRFSYKQIELAYDNTVVVISKKQDKINLTHFDQNGKEIKSRAWRNINYFTMITEQIVCILIVHQDFFADIVLWDLKSGSENIIKYKANKRSIFQIFTFQDLISLIVREIDEQNLKIEYYRHQMMEITHVNGFQKKNERKLQNLFKMNRKSKIGLIYQSQQKDGFHITLDILTLDQTLNVKVKMQTINLDKQIRMSKQFGLKIRDIFQVDQQKYYIQISAAINREKLEEELSRQNKVESKNSRPQKKSTDNKNSQMFYNFYYHQENDQVYESKIQERKPHCIQFLHMYRQLNYKELISHGQDNKIRTQLKTDKRVNFPIYYIFAGSQDIKMIQREQNQSLISWPTYGGCKFVILKSKSQNQRNKSSYFFSIVDIPFAYRQYDTAVFFLLQMQDWDYNLLDQIVALF